MVKQKKAGGAWYYEFMHHGKRYFGTCEGAKSQRQAEAFERTVREKATQAAGLKSVKALYETFREDLTGGKKISLDDAFELSLKKPRKRIPAEKKLGLKRGVWRDFLAFMRNEYPDILNLADVEKKHAEGYIALLRESGKYDKAVSYSRSGKGKRTGRTIAYQTRGTESLSPRTVNFYQVTCAEVFNLLKEDAGLQSNPFADILKMDVTDETREAFTPEELKLIYDNLDNFTRPLFMMAVWTGLREGDICTLKWSDIDLEQRLIVRKTRKTGVKVKIPISDQLYDLIISMPHAGDSEYVFPEHARMYLSNSDGVSYRVKKFLEGLGIQTTRIPEGRTRAISVKDLHSCRHTFCYYAGLAGIPISVVQSIVGHMTPAMTEHYSDHVTTEDKRRGMERLSFFTQDALPAAVEDPERVELHRLIDILSLEQVRATLQFVKSASRKKP
jgi:integrase